jgi:hypothetical protein
MGGNPWSGEVELALDGERRIMRLTLGALAELEAGMEADGLVDLVSRFETGRFRTRDVALVLLAGLRGGGWTGDETDLMAARIEGGPAGAVAAAARLLARGFALSTE